jgi:hypothetical protein
MRQSFVSPRAGAGNVAISNTPLSTSRPDSKVPDPSDVDIGGDTMSTLKRRGGSVVAMVALAVGAGALTTVDAPPGEARVRSTAPAAARLASPPAKGIALGDVDAYWGKNARGIASDLRDVKAAGATWIRLDVSPDAASRATFDIVARVAKARGLRILAVLRKPVGQNDLGTTADRAAFRRFVRQMVIRYRASVKYWEMLDEPNLSHQWNIDTSAGSDQVKYAASVRRYVTLLKDGYRTVKANDPTARVLFGGLSEAHVERYLAVLLRTNAYKYFDAMSFHPYARKPEKVVGRFKAVRDRLRAVPAFAAKPIWITEAGYQSSWTHKGGYVPTEALKARYLPVTIRQLFAAGAKGPYFWYTLHQNTATSRGYGLELKNKETLVTRRLPAFNSFRKFTR